MVIVALQHHERFNPKHKNENQYAIKFRLQMVVECGVLLNTRVLVGWFFGAFTNRGLCGARG